MASNLNETGYQATLAGEARIRVQIVDVTPGDGDSMHGRIHAWAGAGRDSTFSGPLLIFELPDLDVIQHQLTCPVTAWVQIIAIAHAAECFPDEQSFHLWQESRPTPMASDCFIPSGAFARPPRPEAAFAGRIEQAERSVNPVTGLPFHHLRVRTSIGSVDVVAETGSLDGTPLPGSIVQGYFTLSARVVAFG